MRKRWIGLAAAVLATAAFVEVLAFGSTANASSYFVDGNSPGGNGTSWATAFRSLGEALDALRAQRSTLQGTTILHVKAGDYLVGATGGPRPRAGIILDIPRLQIIGQTQFLLDARGLPVGVAASATRIVADPARSSHLEHLVMITADDVTLSNLVLDGNHNVTTTVFVAGKPDAPFARFAIKSCQSVRSFHGIVTRFASGSLTDNLIGGSPDMGSHFGVAVAGSHAGAPAQVSFVRNRVVGQDFFGAVFMGDPAVLVPPGVASVAGELDVNINDNEFTGNAVAGLVLSARENGSDFSAVDQRATLRAAVFGNRMIGNSQYGMAFHAPQGVFTNNDRLCPPGIPAEIHATFSANSFSGNGRNGALFTFTAVLRSTSSARACYIRDSLMDSDYTGAFDYDNPDRYGNTLRVNGQEYEGQSITH